MISTVSIRSPTVDDLNDIVKINRLSLPENYPVAYFIDLIQSWKKYSSVAVVNDKVVGYLILRLENNRSFFSKTNKYTKGHIISVAVLDEARRKGLASAMLTDVLEKIESLTHVVTIELEVRESNIAAIKLYENFNFIKAKIISRYYSDGENAVLMTLHRK